MQTLADIQFTGTLNPWVGLTLAVVFALGTWWLYRRETAMGDARDRFARVLPILRIVVVVLVILMLTGPVLRYNRHIGDPGRVMIFIDASESMGMDDKHMDAARKLLIARQRGWLDEDALDTTLHEAAERLRAARGLVERAVGGGAGADPAQVAAAFHAQVEGVSKQLEGLNIDAMPSAQSVRTGVILREYWLDVPGSSVADLTRHRRFAGPASGSHTTDMLEAPSDVGESYGARFRGYVHPPTDGQYTFWIAADDEAELWLSTDERAANKRLIARLSQATARRGWTDARGRSDPITLRGERRYYIEVLHKEHRGADYLAVGWRLPVGGTERPIPGHRLSPYAELSAGPTNSPQQIVAAFQRDLLGPAAALARDGDDPSQIERLRRFAELARLADAAGRWQTTFETTFSTYARQLVESGDAAAADAIRRHDALTRWQRARSILLDHDGFIPRLMQTHRVEVHALRRGESQVVWISDDEDDPPADLAVQPDQPLTDLSGGLQQRAAQAAEVGEADDDAGGDNKRLAAVLLSDGGHNLDDASPVLTSDVLGDRRIPLYTIGFGALNQPEDLSIRTVEAPQAVFFEDRVQGEIVLADHMPPGKPFTVSIQVGGETVWDQELVTDRSDARRVPYDFSVKQFVEDKLKLQGGDMKVLNLPLEFSAVVTPVAGEAEPDNNAAPFTVQAITEPRRVLILDGRPRWETRYIRNLFERDKRWAVGALIGTTNPNRVHWPRANALGAMPVDRQTLYKYDLIVLGDVPRQMFRDDELDWIRDFVGDRGGGLLLLDGQRGHLRHYLATPIGELLPIEWTRGGGDNGGVRPTALRLTETGASLSTLRLTGDPHENRLLWAQLNAPHWVAATRAAPGTETLVEAVAGGVAMPAVVQRPYGAGRVLYLGFDESWRWRYEVADRYHGRFWNQVAKWVGEAPYAVEDEFAKLDAGKPSYAPGERAEIRARLRDRDGRPLTNAEAQAVITRDGKPFATVPLATAQNKGGVFRAQTPPLEPGEYEVALRVAGFDPADMKARARFTVEQQVSLEKRTLIMDEKLLSTMAGRARGRYFREEDVNQLIDTLQPLSLDKMQGREIVLWRSYWWFVPIIALLTAEWILRKKAGMM